MVKTAKKSISQKSTVKKEEVDSNILEKSLNLIKKLNSEVESVNKIKDKLKKDIQNINKKIEVHEKSKSSPDMLEIIKNEVMDDFSNILDKFNIKHLKKELNKEIEKIVTLEIEKLNSSINSKQTKSKKELDKKFNELEIKLIEISNSDSKLKKELKSIKNNEGNIDIIIPQLKEELESLVESKSKLFNLKLNKQKKELTLLITSIENHENDIKILITKTNSIKKELKKFSQIDPNSISEINLKIDSIKSENNKLKEELKSYDTIINSHNTELKNSIKIIEIEKKAQKDLLIKKYDELVEQVKNIEENFSFDTKKEIVLYKEKLEEKVLSVIELLKKDLGKFKNENKGIFEKELKNITKFKSNSILEYQSKFSNIILKNEDILNSKLKEIDSEFLSINNNFKNMKESLLNNIKDYISELDSELLIVKTTQNKTLNKNNSLNEKIKLFENKFELYLKSIGKEKRIERDFIAEKINDLTEKFNEIVVNNDKLTSSLKKELKSSFNKEVEGLLEKEKDFEKEKNNLVSNVKELVSTQISNFEDKFKLIVKKVDKNLEDNQYYINDKVKSLEGKFNNLENSYNSTISNVEKNLKENLLNLFDKEIKSISKKEENNQENFSDLKKELLNKVKGYISELDSQLNIIKNKEDSFSKDKSIFINNLKKLVTEEILRLENKLDLFSDEFSKEKLKERDFIIEKINNLVDKFNSLSKENSNSISSAIVTLNKKIENKIEKNLEIISKSNAKLVLDNSQFQIRISTEIKEEKQKLAEDIDEKFVTTKNQFDQNYNEKLAVFGSNIKEIENLFNEKLSSYENQKEQTLNDLKNFKSELKNSDNKYKLKLESELDNIKSEGKIFEEKKEEFVNKINQLSKEKRLELNDYVNNLTIELKTILEEEKQAFEIQENSFKDTFTKKVSLLNDTIIKRLDSIDKEILNKNKKELNNILEEEKQAFDLVNNQLKSKSDEIEKSLLGLENKENDLFENILAQEKKSSEKVEERLMGLEKQLNKRFLDLDLKFSEFKGVVVDEVEDLINEVNTIIKTKVSELDKNLTKISFINNEAQNRINGINKFEKAITNEILNLRNELNDVRVKTDILTPEPHSLNDHIEYMKTYENQLISLIGSLKEKGITEDTIKQALISKGHPRFYVSAILRDYDELFN